MIKILDSSQPLSVLSVANNNGLGSIQPLTAIVTEELNGIYELEFTCLTTDKHYEDLQENGLVKVTVGDGSEQIFRIYSVSNEIDFTVEVRCQHITYDLSKVVVVPFKATGAVLAKDGILSHMLGEYPFTMTTDILNNVSTFTLDIPRSFRECLGGYEGSLLDVFRGEYEWDNLNVKMLAKRGHDNGVRISYGKNLTDYEQEINNESVYDAVYGYAIVDDVIYQASSVYNKTGASTPKVLVVDFSDKYDMGKIPTSEELLNYATSYANGNAIEVPKVNIKIDFVPLWQTEEYKNILPLERVSLGDTVHVFFDKLNVEASSRVIKTVWNVNLQKYDSIELGDSRSNMNTVINDAVKESVDQLDIDINTSFLEGQLNQMASVIINGLGLHYTLQEAGDGYRIYLHNKSSLAESDTQYIMTSEGFLISTDYGQTWNAGFDSEGNAVLNSLATITLRALEIYGSTIRGSTIIFGDVTDKYITAQPYSGGITFDGTGTIRMRPQDRFYIYNLSSDGSHSYNQFSMNKEGSTYKSNFIGLFNYDDQHNYLEANFIELDAHFVSGGDPYNRTVISNKHTFSGNSVDGNYVRLRSYETENNLALYNNKPGVSSTANYIYLSSSSTAEALSLYNYKLGETTTANYLTFNSNSTQNVMSLNNYQFSSSNYANRLYFRSNSSGNLLQINNNKLGSASSANYLEFTHDSSSGNKLTIANVANGTGLNYANLLTLKSDSSGNTINLRNLASDDSGVSIVKNDLTMSSDNITTLWSSNDLRLRSGGAVRIYANHDMSSVDGDTINGYNGSTQDTYVGGYSLKLQCMSGGKIYLYWGSTRVSLKRVQYQGTNFIGYDEA